MSLVLDASVAIAWCFPKETTSAVEGVFAQVERSGAWIPALWHFEVANVLIMSVRAGRCTGQFRDRQLADLSVLPMDVEATQPERIWQSMTRLAERHRLTLYDAAYLELAIRRTLPLATLDAELRTAAAAEAVPLLGL